MIEVEKIELARFDAGRIALSTLAEARFARIEAEVEVERAKTAK
jgi:hypothetical protein